MLIVLIARMHSSANPRNLMNMASLSMMEGLVLLASPFVLGAAQSFPNQKENFGLMNWIDSVFMILCKKTFLQYFNMLAGTPNERRV